VGGRPEDSQSWNRYTYAKNNPISLIDPDGKQEMLVLTPEGPLLLPGPIVGPQMRQSDTAIVANAIGDHLGQTATFAAVTLAVTDAILRGRKEKWLPRPPKKVLRPTRLPDLTPADEPPPPPPDNPLPFKGGGSFLKWVATAIAASQEADRIRSQNGQERSAPPAPPPGECVPSHDQIQIPYPVRVVSPGLYRINGKFYREENGGLVPVVGGS